MLEIQKQNFFIGVKWEWTETFGSFLSSDYTAKCYLKNSTNSTITINGVADGDGFKFTKEDTSGLTKGNYKWQILLTPSGESTPVQIFSGQIYIDVTLDADSDARTFAEKMLALLQTAYENRANDDHVIEITTEGGKSLKFTNAAALRDEIKIWANAVERERSFANNTFRRKNSRVLTIN